jgi:hypothetical protein
MKYKTQTTVGQYRSRMLVQPVPFTHAGAVL